MREGERTYAPGAVVDAIYLVISQKLQEHVSSGSELCLVNLIKTRITKPRADCQEALIYSLVIAT